MIESAQREQKPGDTEESSSGRVIYPPVSGLSLHRIFRLDDEWIGPMAWSPDGARIAAPCGKTRISLWDAATGDCLSTLVGHSNTITSVAWSPDGMHLASGSFDTTCRIWNVKDGVNRGTLRLHKGFVTSVAWSPDGEMLASCSRDTTVSIWNVKTEALWARSVEHSGFVNCVAWSPDGQWLASASDDCSIFVRSRIGSIGMKLVGHSGPVLGLAWMPNRLMLASCSHDKTIRIWDVHSGKSAQVIEGHTGGVNALSFSADGQLMASKSRDNTICVWRTDSWATVARIDEEASAYGFLGLAFHPHRPFLATLGGKELMLRTWELDLTSLLGEQSTADSIRYTTAKLVLVGDSGVGKTGLGWRLAHREFKEHASTHGQQFWVIDDLCVTRKDGTECEAVLWDLAGQHVYRSVHAIFLDDVDLSLVLFDPSNRQEPLKGAQFWLEQLAGKNKLPPSVLVGARLDRGAPVLSQQELDQFCQLHGISGGYVGTSAKTRDGLDQLLEILRAQIPWDQMTATITTLTFKRTKEHVLSLKEQPDRQHVLIRPADLRKQLEVTDSKLQFTDSEMMTAVKHLENHGYVTLLRGTTGEDYILLSPEILVGLASSIVLQADKHPRELGSLNETALLAGSYAFQELTNLDPKEQQVLLDAALVRFLEHNICFRETLGADSLLIFPGLIKQKRPLLDEVETIEDVSYIVRGRVENVYPALVVLLGYTQTFARVNQWQNQAQYEMDKGEICGFRLIEEREGEIELVLYYSSAMPSYGRIMFQGLFEKFLYQRDVEVTRFPPVLCPQGHRQERATVVKRLREGKEFLFCEECGENIKLPEISVRQLLGARISHKISREEALARLRSTYEAHLLRVKSFRRDRESPRCYLSRVSEQAEWAVQLDHDLRDAGVYILEDPSQVQEHDFIIVVGSPAYKRSWEGSNKAVAADANLVRAHLQHLDKRRPTIVPLVVEAGPGEALPREVRVVQSGIFRDDTRYVLNLFELVLTLYAIPHSHPAFEIQHQSLSKQWQETLGGLKETPPRLAAEVKETGAVKSRTLKIFISYSHKDEDFKDDLVTILAGMQRRRIIDAWQDRRIEAGNEWYRAIQGAISECQLALLLVSKHFLASRFIQDDELPRLLKRRKDEGLRIIPIIVGPCLWQSEPVLSDLQALPKDGRPVVSIPVDNGGRDQAWMEIAQAIEHCARKLTEELGSLA